MSKILRTKQEIFAQQAGSRQITAFGTAKTETPEYTTDLTQIQNTNFLQGWFSAVLPDKAPYEEDTNALFYAITRQLAYLFQEGLAEYDAGTTYYIGSMVKNIDNQGNITIYKSVVDNNTGNGLNDDNYWRVYQSDGSAGVAMYEIGLPQPTFSNTLLSNEIWLEGQTVLREQYAQLFEIYGEIYGAGDGSTTFKLPDCRNRVLWGATSFGYIEAGLPDHNHSFPLTDNERGAGQATQGSSTIGIVQTSFASTSNGIYGNSNTVQPPAIKCRVKTRFK